MLKFKLTLETGIVVEQFAPSKEDAIEYAEKYYGKKVISAIHLRSCYDKRVTQLFIK